MLEPSILDGVVADLPLAEAAWRAHKDRVSADREAEEEEAEETDLQPRPTLKKCPYCAEVIRAEARKCKHCGELLDRSLREQDRRARESVGHVHVSSRSGGTAAVLEVIFGLFLGTFGIGHIYAGNVGTGLFLMFGWWFFVAVAVCAGFLTLGLGWFIIPACWFLMLVLSPIVAASSVG
jgi:hypothetical protein